MAGISWIASRSLAMTGWGGRSLAMTGRLPVAADDVLQNRHDGEEEEEGR